MTHTGRCYCGEINFEFDDPIHSQLLCHCRECRYLSGGEPNASIVITEENFRVTKGQLKTFRRDDLEAPRVRYFCGDCGTHVCVESPPRPGMLVLKIGTLDDLLGLVHRHLSIALINNRSTKYVMMCQILKEHHHQNNRNQFGEFCLN